MSNLNKPRAKRDGYVFAFENPPKARRPLRRFEKTATPTERVLRVNPLSLHQAYVTQSPPKLGALVAPTRPPSVAQPARDNVMERPVYRPRQVVPTRPGAMDAFALPSLGACK